MALLWEDNRSQNTRETEDDSYNQNTATVNHPDHKHSDVVHVLRGHAGPPSGKTEESSTHKREIHPIADRKNEARFVVAHHPDQLHNKAELRRNGQHVM